MRWDNLRIDGEEEHNLPGYRDPALVRRFDAPEALETNFYEVRAKSALNRVPKASRMPFRWTINPYRGCTHSCVWCLCGETPILMADGRHKPLAEIVPGDRIYGTVREGSYRRYVTTEVLAHWESEKRAYRVTLEDGTEVVASADHRFLTRRGWKHVIGAWGGPLQRPHLTLNDQLLGVGQFAAQPVESAEYRRGYLCGIIRGDGHLRPALDDRSPDAQGSHAFRLALADFEALRRTREYLRRLEIETSERQFAVAAGTHREIRAISAGGRSDIRLIRQWIRWPDQPGPDWAKGFLAGLFDAEGSCGGEALRISNTDHEIIEWADRSLRRFCFFPVIEDPQLENGILCVRLLGGLPEKLRFFHTVDPAITRKRLIEGTALKCQARLRVTSIDPLPRRVPLFDITTGTGDFIANGVVSHNCFARPTHTYLDFNAREDFEKQIVVKINAPELVRAETRRPSWKRELVAIGTNTDPYQWVEGRYKLMPGIWEALRDSRTPCSVLTKSPLVTRDVALLKEMSDMGLFSAAFSVPTIDEKAWRASEPRTPNPYARLEAAAELSRNGIAVSVLVAPLMPGINDDPRQVERILELAAEAGVVNVSGIHLHLRGEVKDITMDWLRSYRPDLIPRYESLYGRGAYAPTKERDRMSALVEDGWAKLAPERKPRARYVRTADDPASHRVPEAAQEEMQVALF